MRIYHKILILSLISFFWGCKHDPNLKLAEKLMDTAYDSAYAVLQNVNPDDLHLPSDKALYALLYCQALDKNEIYTGTDSLISIATDYYEKRNDEKAAYSWFYKSRIADRNSESVVRANALLKAQNHAQNTENHNLLALIYSDKALMYSDQLLFDSAALYNNRAANSFKNIQDDYNYILNKLNEVNMIILLNKNNMAVNICDSLSQMEVFINSDVTLKSYFCRTLGALYFTKGEFTKSITFYKQTPITNNIVFDDNTKYLLAKSYLKTNEIDSALVVLNSLTYLGEMAPDYYKLLTRIYERKGNYKIATINAVKAYIAIDSTYTKRIDQSFAGMEKKFNYQKLQISNRELQIKYFRSIAIILLFLLIISIGIAVIFFWRNRVKRKQLEIEKQLVINQTLRAEKEEENSKLLEQQLSLQKIIFTNLEQYRNNALKRPESIKEGFSPVKNNHFFQELFASIDTEYNNFSKRLSEQFKLLTDTDILICCLLLAGFETGMIASILDIKVESMHIRRSRLRKRLQLDNDVNLLDYLRQF